MYASQPNIIFNHAARVNFSPTSYLGISTLLWTSSDFSLCLYLCQLPSLTSHTSYLCQNLSVFTFLLHVSKLRRPSTPSQIFKPAQDTCRSRGRPLQYIGLLITLEGLSVPAADHLLILVFIVALFSCNPPSSLIRDLSGDFANNFDSCRC